MGSVALLIGVHFCSVIKISFFRVCGVESSFSNHHPQKENAHVT